MQIIKKTAKGTTYKLVTSYTSPGDGYERADNTIVRQEDFPEVFAEHGHQWAKYQKWNIRDIPQMTWASPIRIDANRIIVMCSCPGNRAFLWSTDNGKTYTRRGFDIGGDGAIVPIGYVDNKIIFKNSIFGNRYFHVSADYGGTWTGYTLPGEKNWNNCVYMNGLYFVSASDASYILYGSSLSSLTSSSTLENNLEGNATGVYYMAVIDEVLYIRTNLKSVVFYTTNGSDISWQRSGASVSSHILNFNEFNDKYYLINTYGVSCHDKYNSSLADAYNFITFPLHPGAWAVRCPLSFNNIHFGILYYNGDYLLYTLNKLGYSQFNHFDTCAGLNGAPGTGDAYLDIHTNPMIEAGDKIQFFHWDRLFELSDTYDYETEFRLPYIENGWIKKE